MARGRFIVLEGGDGAGTTTQMHALEARLRARGHDVLCTAQPSRGAVGQLARANLAASATNPLPPEAMALLFAADRLEHVHGTISPALDAGTWVICDRYVLSSMVYQGLALPEAWIASVNQFALAPDITLFVDTSDVEAARRRTARGGDVEIFDGADVQASVLGRYRRLAQDANVFRVDGDGSREDVTTRIWVAMTHAGLV